MCELCAAGCMVAAAAAAPLFKMYRKHQESKQQPEEPKEAGIELAYKDQTDPERYLGSSQYGGLSGIRPDTGERCNGTCGSTGARPTSGH